MAWLTHLVDGHHEREAKLVDFWVKEYIGVGESVLLEPRSVGSKGHLPQERIYQLGEGPKGVELELALLKDAKVDISGCKSDLMRDLKTNA